MAHKKLTALTIKSLNKPGYYRDRGDGAVTGLYIQVIHTKAGNVAKSWVFRFVSPVTGKARWMGLGSANDIGLADARELASNARRLKTLGIDPIDERNKERQARKIDAAKQVTFKQAADRYIAAHSKTWKNAKHAAQWPATLKTYVYPTFGELPVSAVDKGLVLKVLEPIWTTKPETAGRVRGRIETVLDWAKAHGYRDGENPARWRGHLDKALPSRRKVRAVRNHPALPYAEIPAFMADLRNRDGVSPRALEFVILTAARTSEVIEAVWDEINLREKLWTLPAERMKAGKEHKVPLSDRAVALLRALPREKNNPYLFIGAKAGASLSNMAMLQLMRDLRPGFVPHGFRSTFRDWAGDQTGFDRQTIEFALAHGISDATEAAYRRGTAIEKRRRLMAAWADYCGTNPKTRAGSNVVVMQAGA